MKISNKEDEIKRKKIFLIGGKGRLGQSIAKVFNNHNLVVLDRKTYKDWFLPERFEDIKSKLETDKDSTGNIIMILSGIMNPDEDKEFIFKINYELPKNIIKANEGTNNKIVTFGSVMEDLSPQANNYISSKKKLSSFVEESKVDILSLKIHTLYGGGPPNEFMFLGQLLESFKNKNIFEMSSGNQLREYHHVDDDAMAIKELLYQNISGKEIISHGDAIPLKKLTKTIFKNFNKLDQLKIGSLPDRINENYNIRFTKNPNLDNIMFRNTFDGVTDYLQKFLD